MFFNYVNSAISDHRLMYNYLLLINCECKFLMKSIIVLLSPYQELTFPIVTYFPDFLSKALHHD